MPKKNAQLNEAQLKIQAARHHDPFSVLGMHKQDNTYSVCVFSPHTQTLSLPEYQIDLIRIPDSDFFYWSGSTAISTPYQLKRLNDQGHTSVYHDPYSFPTQLSDYDIHLYGAGSHWHIYRILGAHLTQSLGVPGVLLATWAPNAERVSVVGDFNNWDGRCHPMRNRGACGIWEIFIPEMTAGSLYKFEIRNRDSGAVFTKTDPYGQQFELRPKTSSIVCQENTWKWQDARWMQQRQTFDWLHQPMSIYEVHLSSWQKDENGHFLNYRELAHRLVSYLQTTGFTHIELLPITEHPLDASWGYQTTGYFAATSRFGSTDDFRYFVDYCHQHNIGVFLDWVPAHFPKDAHGLARYDGSALYEHEDPRRGEHRDWGTLIYNYGRNEVKNMLLASALFWLEECHIDGLRVDAVASMLYLDYSREHGDWVPNMYGGNENLEAIAFFRELNSVTHAQHPGTVIMAEESTAWPQVTRPTHVGGLGFSMKWNMGWMHDTLSYMSKPPIYRHYHHNQLTFGLLYLFTENFILPFSHDEVVHGKGSMLNKMPGDEWQKFANLRLLYTYMFTYPGKKLLFMGCEFGQGLEWNHNASLDWYVLQYAPHHGVQKLIGDLNKQYREHPALYRHDFEHSGFEWIDCNDTDQSVLSYLRRCEGETLVVILNFTPVPRYNYRVGVPQSGQYREIINSDSEYYAGTNMGNYGVLHSQDIAWMNRPCSVELTLPPLAGVVLKLS
ncbi:MAG: 1,4-alpha-glucan branching protein GlgB [Gammaproteobacteria bacterium]|nr:1,4-alpha-glucan branching protein GlgB [Gammaproteobacteria bacterium]